jgi:hypothetical protein|tara:strand:- start:6619 stop:6912 length:294 start_codon:yes stop_codon:yes gene_type:complete
MLKLIEIRNGSSEYDPVARSCKSSFFLKELYLNPDHIIMMRENSALKSKATRGLLVDGIDKNMSFTELVISTPGHMSKIINIVGSPGEIFKDCTKVS